MAEVVRAFCWSEPVEDELERVADGVERAGCGPSKQRFEFGEELFDGVEVRAVRREVEQRHSGLLEALPDAGHLVRRQVVADDDAARLHLGNQVFDEPLSEDDAGHRSVDQHRREDAVVLEPGHERRGHPVTVWRLTVERFAPVAPAAGSDHARRRSGLVDEHQPVEVEPGLGRSPDVAGERDVRPILLAGVDRPFFCAAAPAA